MSKRANVPGIKPYNSPAGGWGALRATAKAVRDQMDVHVAPKLLLRTNKPDGFDCPGCAWPDKDHTSAFQFCENGAKAVTWEATKRRVTLDFFYNHTVTSLLEWTDLQLENEGRLTHPVAYNRATDTYQAVTWNEAFERIGTALRALPDPNMAEFYTSGRTSNEAAFLYQIFVREYGTNNFPDCSNMCHEGTSVGLPKSIGVGKGTVSLDDFEQCDLIISIGHNPGTNHPRMMGTLWEASRRGVPISRLAALALRRPPTHGHAAQLHGGFQPHAEKRNTNGHRFLLPLGHAIALRGRVCGQTVRTRRPPPVSARGTRAAVHVEPRRRDLTLTL